MVSVVVTTTEGIYWGATSLGIVPYEVLELVALVVSNVNGLVSLRVHGRRLPDLAILLSLVDHAVRSHHASPADLGYPTHVAVPLVTLPIGHGGRRDDGLVGREVLARALWRTLNRIQLSKSIWAATVGARSLVHYRLLVGFVLTTGTAAYGVLALIVVDGAEVLGACNAAWAFGCSGKAAAFAHVPFIGRSLSLWMQPDILVERIRLQLWNEALLLDAHRV